MKKMSDAMEQGWNLANMLGIDEQCYGSYWESNSREGICALCAVGAAAIGVHESMIETGSFGAIVDRSFEMEAQGIAMRLNDEDRLTIPEIVEKLREEGL